MVANMTLDEEQVAFLLEHHDVIDALFELAQTDEFREKFGEQSVSEVLSRFENTLTLDEESDVILSQRYQRLKSELEHNDPAILLNKLRDSSLFDDLNQDEN
jgi:hypothetical protein